MTLWPFGDNDDDLGVPYPDSDADDIGRVITADSVQYQPFGPDARPVDVAILYGLGQKDRAQQIARKLRPVEIKPLGGDR